MDYLVTQIWPFMILAVLAGAVIGWQCSAPRQP